MPKLIIGKSILDVPDNDLIDILTAMSYFAKRGPESHADQRTRVNGIWARIQRERKVE